MTDAALIMGAIVVSQYPGFEQPSNCLHKFISAGDIFTILLKDGTIVHYTPTDRELFKTWLLDHEVIDIKIDQKS